MPRSAAPRTQRRREERRRKEAEGGRFNSRTDVTMGSTGGWEQREYSGGERFKGIVSAKVWGGVILIIIKSSALCEDVNVFDADPTKLLKTYITKRVLEIFTNGKITWRRT